MQYFEEASALWDRIYELGLHDDRIEQVEADICRIELLYTTQRRREARVLLRKTIGALAMIVRSGRFELQAILDELHLLALHR
jgi:hypothetical protein